MKRRFGTVIAMVLCFILTVVSVYADDGKGQNPDYVTDYYMIVQSTQGGVDIYDEADTQSVKLNDSKIPNGTAIHVLGEKNGADNKKWAYTQYHEMNGYVPMDDLDPASREEAANEEYRTFGGKDVDFEVKVMETMETYRFITDLERNLIRFQEQRESQMGQLYIFFSMFREKTEQTGGNRHRWCDTGMAES